MVWRTNTSAHCVGLVRNLYKNIADSKNKFIISIFLILIANNFTDTSLIELEKFIV